MLSSPAVIGDCRAVLHNPSSQDNAEDFLQGYCALMPGKAPELDSERCLCKDDESSSSLRA